MIASSEAAVRKLAKTYIHIFFSSIANLDIAK